MTRKVNDANFFVEKYAIARDATSFEKDAQAPDATLFLRRAPSSAFQKGRVALLTLALHCFKIVRS